MKFDKKKELTIKKEDVIKNLPEFINLVVLFLCSGTSIEDSICKIASSYKDTNIYIESYFKRNIVLIYEEYIKTGENIVQLFYRFSKESNIKELTRLSNIIIDNKKKGTELIDKLKIESDSMWQERKRLFEEKIKLLDSKLSFPLAITLIALILVAAAPALLEIT